jgi:hypothetical protein
MFSLLREYFNGLAEREAEKLLKADVPAIDDWRKAVNRNINSRRGRWADLAYLKHRRLHRYG